MLETGKLGPHGQPQPMSRRTPESTSTTAPGRSARRAECLRRADAVAKLGVELHLAVHDLRNLLSNAALNASLLARRIGTNGAEPDNVELLESVRRDLRLVQDTLHHVTQLADDQGPVGEPVDVSALLTDVRRLAWTAAHATGDVRVAVAAADRPLFVHGSRNRLLQAFFALVRNAIEASQAAGEVRIEVEARGLDVYVRVRDQGPGLPAELRERAFEEFESTKPGGLGVGLCVARRIIAEHAGALTLSSLPGSGVCAEVRLARSDADHVA
jgi:signal transduction histidine kinase